MSFLRAIVGFVVAIYVVLFTISNRQAIEFYPSPVHHALELPLYSIGLFMLGAGFLFGALTVWLNNSGLRQDRRHKKRQIKTLEKELNKAQDTGKNKKPPSDFFPALPKSSTR